MKINAVISGALNAFALINASNPGLTLDATKVTLGAVSAAVGTGTRNSKVTLTAIATKGYTGTVDVSYHRTSMTENVAVPDLTYDVSDATTKAELLTAAANALGLREEDVEIVPALVRPGGGVTSSTISLSAKAGSYLYQGAVDLQLTWDVQQVALTTAVPVTDLDGFDPEA